MHASLTIACVQHVWFVSNSPSPLLSFRMSDISESIKDAVISVLPSVPEETLTLLVETILHPGVESKDDLQYIREQEIAEVIGPSQCRKLLNAWK